MSIRAGLEAGAGKTRPTVSFVVAMDRNRLIGDGGAIPWRLPHDLRRFREITMGHAVLMGRKTYESIPARFRPLPGRTNIVLSRQRDYEAPGCLLVHSLQEALAAVDPAQELMVIGGAQLFRELLPSADRIYLTDIDGAYEGDVYFPEFDRSEWRVVAREFHTADEKHDASFYFSILEREK